MQSLGLITAPIFLVLILAEALIGAWENKQLYEKRDTLANLALGVFGLAAGLTSKVITFGIFLWFHQWAVRETGTTVLEFIICFCVSDLIAYGFHRLGHECAAFWAVHSTHHTSEKLNFSTGVRLAFHHPFRFIFWLPMTFFFSPDMMVIVESISFIYQFFLHTELVGKLGPLEWVFNTPSHHRVHHASNPQYLDKNFAGSLIIWDRLFGTFAEEMEKPVYGTVEKFRSHNPAKILFGGWIKLFHQARNAGSVVRALKVMLGKPVNAANCEK
jgi:sterol desaturase/sphingolipid hydroxylase (fatty acid hydroxylase superfamily)